MTATDLPTTMPAAVLKGLMHVEVEDRPLPELGPLDVLLEISHCGICGSDLHFMVEWEGAAKPNTIEGHEYSGTVAAVGADVEGWKVGEEVVGGPSPRCGVCEYCLAGRPSLCLERGKVGAGQLKRCPTLEVPVEGVFYQANANYTGDDEVAYEVKRSDGPAQSMTVKITVGARPKPSSRGKESSDI